MVFEQGVRTSPSPCLASANEIPPLTRENVVIPTTEWRSWDYVRTPGQIAAVTPAQAEQLENSGEGEIENERAMHQLYRPPVLAKPKIKAPG